MSLPVSLIENKNLYKKFINSSIIFRDLKLADAFCLLKSVFNLIFRTELYSNAFLVHKLI